MQSRIKMHKVAFSCHLDFWPDATLAFSHRSKSNICWSIVVNKFMMSRWSIKSQENIITGGYSSHTVNQLIIPRFQRKCLFLYVHIRRFHRHRLTLTIKSSMFHSLATRNECDAFSSGQFSRSAKDPISPFFFCWQGLRAGIRAILGTVAQCRKRSY